MDVPCPSWRRCREDIPSSARNVRARCPVPNLAASQRRCREEAAAATLAARAGAVSARNVRQRVPLPRVPFSGTAAAVSSQNPAFAAQNPSFAAPRHYVVVREFSSDH